MAVALPIPGVPLAPAGSPWLGLVQRNRASAVGAIILILLVLIVLVGPPLAPYDPESTTAGPQTAAPDVAHLMGTDQLGRDILSRVLWGARASVFVGVVAALASTLLGVTVGTISGYFGGWLDEILGRLTEVFMVIPRFFLAIIAVAFFGASLWNIIFAIAILSWPVTSRLVRAEFLTLKTRQFVDAVKVVGASTPTIIFGEILPNAAGTLVVNSTLLVAQSMLLEASLSYLGLGDPNQISWGRMLFDSQAILQRAWWAAVFPGLGIFLAVFSLNLVGDGLADALNPRLRER